MRRFFVYIMTNHARTLYTGITGDLERRVRQHKLGEGRFTGKYCLTRLVWFEDFYEAEQAILAEKRIKGWVRRKKVELIESTNPLWLDLAEHLVGHSEVSRRILPESPYREPSTHGSNPNGTTPHHHLPRDHLSG